MKKAVHSQNMSISTTATQRVNAETARIVNDEKHASQIQDSIDEEKRRSPIYRAYRAVLESLAAQ